MISDFLGYVPTGIFPRNACGYAEVSTVFSSEGDATKKYHREISTYTERSRDTAEQTEPAFLVKAISYLETGTKSSFLSGLVGRLRALAALIRGTMRT